MHGARRCVWRYVGSFRGERWGLDKANAPWRWDHLDDNLPPGMQAFDPLRLVEEFNNLSAVPADQISRKYVDNLYMGLPAGTRPKRPAPIAEIAPKIIIVKPNEAFTLDGGRSHTADLDGRGNLLFHWESQAAQGAQGAQGNGFGAPILGAISGAISGERWIRKTLSGEG